FVYEMYKDHFGPDLVNSEVVPVSGDLRVNTSKSMDGKKIFLMVVNKNMDSAIDCSVEFDDTVVEDEARTWVLNAASVDATNEEGKETVTVTPGPLTGSESAFSCSFEPHSLTAIEFTIKEL
ncbi:MAG: hypothetical protein PHS64_07960, partial [Candidatus Omnitrophica bacterium]|nr:hypothetical protein [Candidatus Omnitrophota bacterium]